MYVLCAHSSLKMAEPNWPRSARHHCFILRRWRRIRTQKRLFTWPLRLCEYFYSYICNRITLTYITTQTHILSMIHSNSEEGTHSLATGSSPLHTHTSHDYLSPQSFPLSLTHIHNTHIKTYIHVALYSGRSSPVVYHSRTSTRAALDVYAMWSKYVTTVKDHHQNQQTVVG